MQAQALLLKIAIGGPLLGIAAGLAVDPDLKPPPAPSWRQVAPDVIFTGGGATTYEAPPQDLDPPRWSEARINMIARRFAADADHRPVPAYDIEPAPLADAPVTDEGIDDPYAAAPQPPAPVGMEPAVLSPAPPLSSPG